MKKFTIITDSTCDINKELIEELDINVIPMEYTIDGESVLDDPLNPSLDIHGFYEKLRHGSMASTSQISPHRYEEIITPHLENNEDVLVICFSSSLSGSYNSARMTCDELREKYPNQKLMVFDSKCASMGEGLFVYHAATLRNEGKSIEEVYEWMEENVLNLVHWFTVEDLDFLKRGGRLSGTVAFIGKMLKIKPVLHVDDLGRLLAMKKAIGRKQSIEDLFKKLEATGTDISNQTIFISHGDSLDDCLYLKNLIEEKYHPKRICINYIGPVIGSHSGPGTIALFFLGSKMIKKLHFKDIP